MKLQIGNYDIDVTRHEIIRGVYPLWDNTNKVNAYRIMIGYGDESISVTYYDSIYKYSMDNVSFTKEDAKDCLCNCIMDAMSSIETFDTFCNEMGFEDTKEARKIYNECAKLHNKLSRLFSDDEMNDILSQIG